MKKIEAIIKSEKIEAVIYDLEKVGYSGLMIDEIAGECEVGALSKKKIEIIIKDKDVNRVAKIIIKSAEIIGNNKIFIYDFL